MSEEEVKAETVTVQSDKEEILAQRVVKEKVSWRIFILFSCLYFNQGAINGLIGTMPYIYPQLPDIDTMALFNSISLPYSFKFLVAPFLQKFASIQYGKRKTWIVISQLCVATLLFIASCFTEENEAKTFAIFCFIIQIGMVVQNIALHSLIIKEITSPHESSMIQAFAEVLGHLFAGFLLLKLTSHEFSKSIGLQKPITTPQVIIISFAIVIFVPILLIHFFFKEKVLECEKRGSTFSFCKIIKNYKVFLKPKTQYFRFCMVALLYNQGLNFFTSLYEYKLVEAGFSRDISNTIGNIVIITIIFFTFYFGKWTESLKGTKNAIILCTSAIVVLCLYILIVFPIDVPSIATISFLLGLLDSWRFYCFGVLINTFPLHAFSGMFVTVLGSYFNFGRLTFVHTELCGQFGWQFLSFLGLGLEVIILIATPKLFDWLEDGDLTLPKQIAQKTESAVDYKQMIDI